MTACSSTPKPEPYGTLEDGREAHLYTLTNKSGMTATMTSFGAMLVGLTAPDRNGQLADVTVGFDDLDSCIEDSMYRGATVGRFGNRLKDGKFTLDGAEYTLATNNGDNHLHGGNVGFNKKLWNAQYVSRPGAQGVEFKLVSPDGEEGYPGTLTVQATYWLNDKNEFIAEFEATTDAPTIVNMVHHTYWNLTGDFANSDVLGHELTLYADQYLPIDEGLIPEANAPAPVAGTPMDFTSPRKIGERVDEGFVQLERARGYDHAWIVNGETGILRPAAKAHDPASGRVMEVWTDQPAIQFYGGNFMSGAPGPGGKPMNFRHALCLETEGYPDAPNRPDFPSPVLRPGDTYKHMMIHRFYTQ